LNVQRVGRLDNFFELGGHSLLIVQLLERLRRIGVAGQARDVFRSPTLADLAAVLSMRTPASPEPQRVSPGGCGTCTQMLSAPDLAPEQLERIMRSVQHEAAEVQDAYPLAPLQAGILFHHLLDRDGGDAYVFAVVLQVQSRAALDRFIAAVQAVVNRHDVLRTAVLWEELPQPIQVVYRRAKVAVEEIALDPDRDCEEQLTQWLELERLRLDLRQAPLLRLRIAADPRTSQWYVLLRLHHIIADATSLAQAIGEIVAQHCGRAERLPESLPFRQHIEEVLAYTRSSDAEAFFREKLGSVGEPTAPFGLLDVHGDGSQVHEARITWPPADADRVRKQARSQGVSVATVLHAAWALALTRLVGREDVVFGSVLLGRAQGSADVARSLGMFINTLPLRIDLRGISAEALVQRTHQELAQLLEHQQAPLAVAQRCSALEGGLPLFSTLLNYVHGSIDLETAFAAVEEVSLVTVRSTTNYPIVLSVGDAEGALHFEMKTDRRLDAQRMLDYATTATASLLDALAAAPDAPALELEVLPAHELRQVIESFNAPRAVHHGPLPLIHQLFEKQVERTPDAVAASCEGNRLTYAELNSAANRLAHFLREHGVGPDQLVGLCVERSMDLIVAVLAVLKAGGAYVPLDPGYPAERLKHMLADCAPRVVLTQEHLRSQLQPGAAQIVTLDGDRIAIQERPACNVAAADVSECHLAYVIYTSGSTGRPKGVMVEHRNVTRLFAMTEQWFRFGEQDVWTLFHSIAFDFSVWELWGALLYGGRVVVVPHLTSRSPRDFYRLLCDEQVTVLCQTPSAFAQLSDAQAQSAKLQHSLRVVIFGGEALELHTLQPWIRRNGTHRPQLVNMYGITETTVHVTYRRIDEQDGAAERDSVIGRPIPDLRVYLLDPRRQPVPVGVAGEIHVGGAGVARGYLNRPELTAQRFIADPFAARPGSRLYRSGDLGRWRADGTLEYLGRNDDQVKIRGFRIELGEIEAQLSRHPQVRDAAVIAREDTVGDRRLVAYVVPQPGCAAPLETDALRMHLGAVLPNYMIPSAFVTLERLPLTVNGKLDRKTLPVPQLDAYSAREYEPPQGEIEERLAEIWQELLQVERVGRRDSFFALGGHSLSAMQVIARIAFRLATEVPIRALFQHPTLRDFAAQVGQMCPTHSLETDSEVEELMERVASLPQGEVHALLQELRTEER
jgi:amino acid adenylation domain-containing protein